MWRGRPLNVTPFEIISIFLRDLCIGWFLMALASRIYFRIFPDFDYTGRWTKKIASHPGNQGLNLQQLPYFLKLRLISILPTPDLRRFSYTSKENYILCLQFRGLPTKSILVENNRILINFIRLKTIRLREHGRLININLPYIEDEWIPFLVGAQKLRLNSDYSYLWNSRIFKVPVKSFCVWIKGHLNTRERQFLFQLANKIKGECQLYHLHFVTFDVQFCVQFMRFRGPRYHISIPKRGADFDSLLLQIKPLFNVKIEHRFTKKSYLEATPKNIHW